MLSVAITDAVLSEDISHAMSWQADEIVARYRRDFGVASEEAAGCFEAFKQFMVVCALGDGIKAPSERIDDMWHTALLFTRSYKDFCDNRLGKFLHHQPIDQGTVGSETYVGTRDEAQTLFGQLDARYWTSAESAARCGGCGSIYVP